MPGRPVKPASLPGRPSGQAPGSLTVWAPQLEARIDPVVEPGTATDLVSQQGTPTVRAASAPQPAAREESGHQRAYQNLTCLKSGMNHRQFRVSGGRLFRQMNVRMDGHRICDARYHGHMDFAKDARDWKNWVSVVARLTLGIVLIVAAAGKVGNLPGSVHATAAYQILPYDVAKVVGYLLPFAEIGLGIVLIAGLFTRIAGALGALMMLGFIIAIVSVWARGISIDCGCFGGGGPIDPAEAAQKYPWEILRDIGLMACGVWLVVIKKPFLAVDTWLFRPAEEIVARQAAKRR